MAFWAALDELIDDLIMADDEEEHCEEEEMLESQDEEVASLHHRTTKNIMEITETDDEEEVSSLSKRSTRFGNMNTKQIICRLLPVFVIAVGIFIAGTYYGVSNKDNSMSDEETLPTGKSSIGNNNINMEEPPPANNDESGQAVLDKQPIEIEAAGEDEEPAILPSTIVNTFTVLEQISHDPTSFT